MKVITIDKAVQQARTGGGKKIDGANPVDKAVIQAHTGGGKKIDGANPIDKAVLQARTGGGAKIHGANPKYRTYDKKANTVGYKKKIDYTA